MSDSEGRDRRYARLEGTIRVYRAGLILCLIIVFILGFMLLAGRRRFARAIRIDGKLVCLVPNKAAADQVRTRLLRQGKGDLPGEVGFSQQWEDSSWPVEDREVLSASQAIKLLAPKLTVLVSAAAITVDDTEVVVMATRELASKVLDALQAKYISEEDKLLARPKFRQNVLIADVQKPVDQILTDIGTAVQQLSQPHTRAQTYVVKAGDYPTKIAAQFKMSASRLFKINPGLKGRTIYAGEKIKVSAPAAPITVVTVKEKTYTKELKAAPEKIESSALPKGERRIVREEVRGKKKVVVECVYENDKLVRKTDLRGEIIQEPIAQIIMVGTGEAAPETQ